MTSTWCNWPHGRSIRIPAVTRSHRLLGGGEFTPRHAMQCRLGASLRATALALTVILMPMRQAMCSQSPPAGGSVANGTYAGSPIAQSDKASRADSSDRWLREAQELVRQNKLDEAEAAIGRYLSEVPGSMEGHVLLGFILFQEDKPNDSLLALAAAKKSHTPNGFAIKIIGLDYAMLKQYSLADQWLTRALSLQPNDAAGWQWLGDVKIRETFLDSALTCYQKSIEIDPGNADSQNAVGALYESMGRTAEATDAFRKAVSLQPSTGPIDPVPYYNLGRILVDQHHAQEALPYLLQAVEIDPESSEAHEQLAKAYSALNRLTESEQEFDAAIARAPNKAALHFQLGQLYKKQGEMEKAQVEFDRFRQLSNPGELMTK